MARYIILMPLFNLLTGFMVVCAPLATISSSGLCNSLSGLCSECKVRMTWHPGYLKTIIQYIVCKREVSGKTATGCVSNNKSLTYFFFRILFVWPVTNSLSGLKRLDGRDDCECTGMMTRQVTFKSDILKFVWVGMQFLRCIMILYHISYSFQFNFAHLNILSSISNNYLIFFFISLWHGFGHLFS